MFAITVRICWRDSLYQGCVLRSGGSLTHRSNAPGTTRWQRILASGRIEALYDAAERNHRFATLGERGERRPVRHGGDVRMRLSKKLHGAGYGDVCVSRPLAKPKGSHQGGAFRFKGGQNTGHLCCAPRDPHVRSLFMQNPLVHQTDHLVAQPGRKSAGLQRGAAIRASPR